MSDLSSGASTKVLLAAAQVDRITKMMAKQLVESGFEVQVVADLIKFKDAVETHCPDIVLIDCGVEYAADLRRWLKGFPHQHLTSLISLYPEGVDPKKQQGFHVLDNKYLVEPYEFEQLKELIEDESQQLKINRQRLKHTAEFCISSQIMYLEYAAEFIEVLVGNIQFAEEKSMAVFYACREALENAIQHGNKNDSERFVQVRYALAENKVTIKVKDDGNGFDVAALLGEGLDGDAVAVARKRYDDKSSGGLGIMLMLRCVDKVEFNRKGNEVTLTKNLC